MNEYVYMHNDSQERNTIVRVIGWWKVYSYCYYFTMIIFVVTDLILFIGYVIRYVFDTLIRRIIQIYCFSFEI